MLSLSNELPNIPLVNPFGHPVTKFFDSVEADFIDRQLVNKFIKMFTDEEYDFFIKYNYDVVENTIYGQYPEFMLDCVALYRDFFKFVNDLYNYYDMRHLTGYQEIVRNWLLFRTHINYRTDEHFETPVEVLHTHTIRPADDTVININRNIFIRHRKKQEGLTKDMVYSYVTRHYLKPLVFFRLEDMLGPYIIRQGSIPDRFVEVPPHPISDVPNFYDEYVPQQPLNITRPFSFSIPRRRLRSAREGRIIFPNFDI